VQDLNFLPGDGPSRTSERRAQLLAAAEAVCTWVHARRETWTHLPVGTAAANLPEAYEIATPVPVGTLYQPVMQQQSVYQVQTYAPPVAVPPVQVRTVPVAPVDQPPPYYQPATGQSPAFQPPSYVPVPLPRGTTTDERAPAAERRQSLRMPSTNGVGALLGGLAQRAKRLAVAAAIVAAAGGAGWTAWSYWSKLPAAAKTGTVLLETVPPDSQVFMDGKVLGDTPLKTELPPGQHTIEFRRLKASRTIEISVTAGTPTVGRLDWTAKRTGRLQVNSDPAGARVLIDGKQRGFTPLLLDDLTVGPHAVVLETVKGSVRRTVTVADGRTAQISESIYSGWVHVSAPIEVTVSEGGRALRLDDRNLILLSPGPHDLQVDNGPLGYRDTQRVDVKPGETTRISIVPPPSKLTVTSTLPAEVLIDGERVGETPLTDHPVALGTRDIVVRNAPGTERLVTITVTVKPVQVDIDFAKP
jgi:hypothetical protein